jgi:hypothetical protein
MAARDGACAGGATVEWFGFGEMFGSSGRFGRTGL